MGVALFDCVCVPSQKTAATQVHGETALLCGVVSVGTLAPKGTADQAYPRTLLELRTHPRMVFGHAWLALTRRPMSMLALAHRPVGPGLAFEQHAVGF